MIFSNLRSCLLLASSVLGGCSSYSAIATAAKTAFTFSSAHVWLEKVKFQIDPDVNNNSPLTIHLLIIYDQDTFNKFSGMASDLYFKNQKQHQKDFGSGKIDFITWEVVPGQILADQTITPTKVSGVGVVIFARYNTPGEHRLILGEERSILLHLEKADFTIQPLE